MDLANLGHYLRIAQDAINSIGMTIALLIMAAVLASAGGIVGIRMRLYGAIVGGMIVNIAVKANGGGYSAALAAMLVASTLAFAIGSTPFLVRLLKRVRPAGRRP